MLDKSKRVLIVGLGLLGGRYAIGLTRAGFEVDAINRSEGPIRYALDEGYIRRGATQDFEPLIREAGYVVFGLYPTTLLDWVAKYGHLFQPGCLITDVSGVKTGLVDEVQALLPEGVEFIGSHPMAGKEVSGVQNAHLVDFAPANFIVTPTERNTQAGIDFAWELAETLGFGHITTLTPAQHDHMIGYVSQLTHAIAVSLMCAEDNGSLAEYTGDSFRDLTRIARINDEMWSELFLMNKPALLAQMDRFSAQFDRLRESLENGDRDTMRDMMRCSTERRALFDKKR